MPATVYMRPYLARSACLAACVSLIVAAGACTHAEKVHEAVDYCPNPVLLRPQLVNVHPSMMALAHDLDTVEKYVEWYGTVVPKPMA